MSNLSYTNADQAFKGNTVHPVLAKLYSEHGILYKDIINLADQDRAGLCDDVAELICMSERQTDKEIAADILISLLRNAENHLKQAVAERFAAIDSAPLRLILQFVNDDIEIAEPVLKYSNALNDLDLLYIIQSRNSPFWQAIAARENLGENVVETLVDTKDIPTAQTLVQNKTALFSGHAIRQVAALANENEILAEALLYRSKQEDGDFAKQVYTYASESLKQSIVEKCGTIPKDVTLQLADVLSEFTESPSPQFMPTASMLKAAELFHEQGKLSVTLMVNTLKRGQISSFIAQFSRFINLPVAVIIPMLQQKNGQGLSIATKANGISRNDFLMIFNFTRKIMGENYLSAHDITIALGYYDRVSPDVAKRLMRQRQN